MLLDMRDPDEYKKWHIRDSINYYYVLLNQDKIFPDLLKFVNTSLNFINLLEKQRGENDHNIRTG
jgi:rhodanese-related sulfurtransferase